MVPNAQPLNFPMLLKVAGLFCLTLPALPCKSAALTAQSLKSEQAFRITGGSVNSGADLLVVTEGSEPPFSMLLKVSQGRFVDQTPLATPEGFLYFFLTAANLPGGLLFAGIDYKGGTVLFTTDVTGSRVTRVGRPRGMHLVSVFDIDGELWAAGQSDQNSPIVGRLTHQLELGKIATFPQGGNAFATKIAKQARAYYVLTQSVGPPARSFVYKLSASRVVLAKHQVNGVGASFALGNGGVAVSYGKEGAACVDFLNLDLKPVWSTPVSTPHGTGAAPQVLAVRDQWLVIGGDNDRTYAARLSSDGQLLDLSYDHNTPPRLTMDGYVLHLDGDVLWIIGSNLDATMDSPRNYNIFSYTIELQSP
jgi:hypothetical protein